MLRVSFTKILVNSILVVLLIAVVGGIYWGYTIWSTPSRVMGSIDEMITRIQDEFSLKPTTIVNETTIYEGTRDIFELATAELEYSIQYVDEQWSLMSKSTTEISGRFIAKAGFDMNEGFEMIVSDSLIVFRYPAPTILSVDVVGAPQIRKARGLWNPISDAELNQTLTLFHLKAEEKAEVDELHLRAEDVFKEKLTAIVASIEPDFKVAFVRNYLVFQAPKG